LGQDFGSHFPNFYVNFRRFFGSLSWSLGMYLHVAGVMSIQVLVNVAETRA